MLMLYEAITRTEGVRRVNFTDAERDLLRKES
jgi:hypothetical protein